MKRRLGLALGLVAAGLAAAVVGLARSDASSWKELPDPPLSPRESPVGFWTGEEVVLVGGSDTDPCPPNADCGAPDVPPLADGAAYKPRTNNWRTIAEPPFGFSWAVPFVFESTAYLWVPSGEGRPDAPSGFLAYRIDDDSWDELSLPTDEDPNAYMFLTLEDKIVAWSWGDEPREIPDFVFDVGSETWAQLPDDPLSPGFDRAMVWTGEELQVFDHPMSDTSEDTPLRGAALDLETGQWRLIDDPDAAWERGQSTVEEGPGRADFRPFGSSDWDGTGVVAGSARFQFVGVTWKEGSGPGEYVGTLHSAAWLFE
jgi:hypothetical protein